MFFINNQGVWAEFWGQYIFQVIFQGAAIRPPPPANPRWYSNFQSNADNDFSQNQLSLSRVKENKNNNAHIYCRYNNYFFDLPIFWTPKNFRAPTYNQIETRVENEKLKLELIQTQQMLKKQADDLKLEHEIELSNKLLLKRRQQEQDWW